MRRPLHRLLPALLLLAAACSPARPVAAAPRPPSLFAGMGGVDVVVFTDLPDAYAAPHGLRAGQVGERVRARLAAAGIPVLPDSVPLDPFRPHFDLRLDALRVAPEEFAVWMRVGISEAVRLPHRSDLPLAVTTWTRESKLVVRGDDVAPLWREIDRLADVFIREYGAANPPPTARGR